MNSHFPPINGHAGFEGTHLGVYRHPVVVPLITRRSPNGEGLYRPARKRADGGIGMSSQEKAEGADKIVE